VAENPEVLKREYNEGHKIANHSYSHVYKALYASPAVLLSEIDKANDAINNALGVNYGNTVFRFPGGSFEKNAQLKNAVKDHGYRYVDWNCVGNDAITRKMAPKDDIINEVKRTSDHKTVTLLLHDSESKASTVEALPEIIDYFLGKGYEFKTVENA
jgi:peptidoglycan/xylan/chitin deacetylase (PgdA/CDA1 family)